MASCGSGFSRKLLATKIKSSRLKPLPRECGHGSSGQQPAHLAQRGHENLDLLVRVVERQRRAAGGADAEPLQQRMRAVLAGADRHALDVEKSEEHTSELQSLMRTSY